MLKLSNIEEYATTVFYSCTVEDENENEFQFTLQEIYNHDTGDLTNIINWVSNSPAEYDEEELIDLCYEELSKIENDDIK